MASRTVRNVVPSSQELPDVGRRRATVVPTSSLAAPDPGDDLFSPTGAPLTTNGIIESKGRTSAPSPERGRDQGVFVSHLEGDAVLVCSGELDPATNAALRRSLAAMVRLAPSRVVVDLSGVSFFDAGAIGELVRARTKSRAAGGDLVVRAPSSMGWRLLDIVGLSNLVERRGPAVPSAATTEPTEPMESTEPTVELAGRFTAGNRSSVVIDEAKGVVSEHFDVGIGEASTMLRSFCTAQDLPILAVASSLMDRTLDVARLAAHRPGPSAVSDRDGVEGADDRTRVARS